RARIGAHDLSHYTRPPFACRDRLFASGTSPALALPRHAFSRDPFFYYSTSHTVIAMAEKKPRKPRAAGTKRRRRKPAGTSTGLAAAELQAEAAPPEVAELQQLIETDGGKVLTAYREPFAGRWLILAALPIDK